MELKAGYKLAEVGTIPEEWAVKSLLDVAAGRKDLFDDGDWIEAEFLSDDGIRLIQTGNIGEGEFVEKDVKKYISAESFEKLRCKDLKVGDILVCRLADPAGRACLLPDIGEQRMITAVDVTIFRPPATVADRGYLVNAFTTPRWFQTVSERCGGSTRTRISRSELGKISIPLPPLPEQRAIAAALSDVDALLDGLTRLIAKKRDLKQAAMKQLLSGQTRLPGFNGEWEPKRLDQLGTWRGGMTPSMQNEAYWTNGAVPWISSGDVKTVLLKTTGFSITSAAVRHGTTTLLPAKAIVVVTRSGILRKYLPVAMNVVPMAINQDIKALIPAPEFCTSFLLHSMISNGDQILARCLKAGTTVESIEFRWLKAFSLLVPPTIAEQTAIATVLSDMDAELEVLEARLEKTRRLKQGMMQELLTGRTRLV